ncbi:MAG: hypothetical protein DMD52_08955 [Gemmatimonadetes bacterium]|nr:MAG: hypothetical protein DMD52_08955 [Gemmatimonadota bacterium]
MTHKSRYLSIGWTLTAVSVLAAVVACSDRSQNTTGPAPNRPEAAATSVDAERQTKSEALAQHLARALAHPAFRAYVKAQLDSSPFREHKLHFQRFLGAHGAHARDEVARHAGVTAAEVDREAQAAIPLEFYLPVPAHRRAWTGDANLLVATALRDHDIPVAFDPQGHRVLLDPDRPPATPVIALVPVETDFTPVPSMQLCMEGCGTGGGGSPPPPPPAPPPPPSGLYMTQAHFVDDFEGWLKGAPEFEVHVLGQKGQSDSLTDYQCAGEKQPAPYYFDQNGLDWSGSVMLFSKSQIDAYNVAHRGQNVRVYVVEDDDTACQIKTSSDAWKRALEAVDAANQLRTAGKDTTSITGQKLWKYAQAFQKLLSALASIINTNDELVGDVVQDNVVGEYHPGFNWIVKGENNVTNGWVQLELK